MIGARCRSAVFVSSLALAAMFAAGCDAVDEGHSKLGVATLAEVSRAIHACDPTVVAPATSVPTPSNRGARTQCDRIVYVMSSLMPLSSKGIDQISAAARKVDAALYVVDASELYRWQRARVNSPDSVKQPLQVSQVDSIASTLITAGATAHFPSVGVFRGRQLMGHAILGYKTADAYESAIVARLRYTQPGEPSIRAGTDLRAAIATPIQNHTLVEPGTLNGCPMPAWRDFAIEGPAGSYFRWWPGTSSVIFEMREEIHILELSTGERWIGPGFVDLIPSPDGRILVTPTRNEGGLAFYDAVAVQRTAAQRGDPAQPIYIDSLRSDQYPSIGVLPNVWSNGTRTVRYRVLTSWFQQAAFRDYDVTTPANADLPLVVRPVGPLIPICTDLEISIPIISEDGREIGARDELTGTTKLFSIDDDGTCTELLDLEIPTGKIAFAPQGQRIAFAVPPGVVADLPQFHGVFILDRASLLLSKIAGSEEMNRLTFPQFTDSGILFMMTSEHEGWSSSLRFVPMTQPEASGRR